MVDRTNGLPPVAAERIRRQAASHVSGSLLSTPALAALAAADLEPVGEVMGCIVMHLGWTGFGCGGYVTYGAGNYGAGGYGARGYVTPILSSQERGWLGAQGYGPYVRARYHAYDTVLNRLVAEIAGLQADGAVGVTLKWSQLDSGATELIALGTAVQDKRPERRRPAQGIPFCTELTGEDVASAVLSGWRPLGMAIGLAIAVKHHDWQLDQQTSWLQGAGNTEVDGLTGLLHTARADARTAMTQRAERFPGARQIVVSGTDLRVTERECGQDQRDHIAEASYVSTVLARDPDHRRRPPASSLTILPLRGGSSRNYEGAPR